MSVTRSYQIPTSHGLIAVEEAGRGDLPVVMIHGNSSCRAVFAGQLNGHLAVSHRLIALDLPGHGESGDAPEPTRTYTRPGFADAVIEVLTLMGVEMVVLVGWSLGGHIALEMAPRLPVLRGAMIIGTPPVGAGRMADGFRSPPHMRLAAQQHLSPDEIETFGGAVFGTGFDQPLRTAMARADGRARRIMFDAARAGVGIDQRLVVETLGFPLAVVNGADDPLINLDYLDGLDYANLWGGRCIRIPGAGHAPFRDAPAAFDPILARFLDAVALR